MELTSENAAAPPPQGRVCLNVGGQKFETYQATLASISGTKISNLSKTDPSYSEEKEEYFFDRNPCLFPFILETYHVGKVTFPNSIPASSIKSELLFWGLDEDRLSPESARICKEWEDGKKLTADLNKAVNDQGSAMDGSKHSWWLMLEYPFSSWKAMIWCAVYTLLLILTVMVISCMTAPAFSFYIKEKTGSHIEGYSRQSRHSILDDSEVIKKLIGIHVFCALFFLIDLITRFILCPSKIEFFKSFFNIIDIVGIFLMIILAIIDVFSPHVWNVVVRSVFFAAVSILRALRLLKIVRQSRHLYVLILAAKASVREYLFLVLATFIGMIIFTTIIFYCESEAPDSQFSSIPGGFWYTIVSMTTVGYGDITPVTMAGKIIGAVCIAYGLTMALITIPVFIFNYMKFRAIVDL